MVRGMRTPSPLVFLLRSTLVGLFGWRGVELVGIFLRVTPRLLGPCCILSIEHMFSFSVFSRFPSPPPVVRFN